MAIGGAFRELIPLERVVATENFDNAWYPGEAMVTTIFEEMHDITKVSVTILYESQDARDTARRSGMEHGMATGYDRLEQLLPTL